MLDRYDPSYHHFQSLWGVGDYAEAALHSGHLDQGRAVLAELETLALTVRSPWLAVGLLVRATATCAGQRTSNDLFREGARTPICPGGRCTGRDSSCSTASGFDANAASSMHAHALRAAIRSARSIGRDRLGSPRPPGTPGIG